MNSITSLSESFVVPPVRVTLARWVSNRSISVTAAKLKDDALIVSEKESVTVPFARSMRVNSAICGLVVSFTKSSTWIA